VNVSKHWTWSLLVTDSFFLRALQSADRCLTSYPFSYKSDDVKLAQLELKLCLLIMLEFLQNEKHQTRTPY